jgi:hypothetical protein
MREYPRWRGLKHFNHVTTTTFADGESFLDILKVCSQRNAKELKLTVKIYQCVLNCLVQLLGKDDPLVHCVRAYQQYRLAIGLTCSTGDRLERVKEFILEYNRLSAVSTKLHAMLKPKTYTAHLDCLRSGKQEL